MSTWPDAPAGGELIRLPVALAPMLCAAVGYSGAGRCLALVLDFRTAMS
jgi:hypothetical protein